MMEIFLGLGAVLVGFMMALLAIITPASVFSGVVPYPRTFAVLTVLFCGSLIHTAFTLFQYAVQVL